MRLRPEDRGVADEPRRCRATGHAIPGRDRRDRPGRGCRSGTEVAGPGAGSERAADRPDALRTIGGGTPARPTSTGITANAARLGLTRCSGDRRDPSRPGAGRHARHPRTRPDRRRVPAARAPARPAHGGRRRRVLRPRRPEGPRRSGATAVAGALARRRRRALRARRTGGRAARSARLAVGAAPSARCARPGLGRRAARLRGVRRALPRLPAPTPRRRGLRRRRRWDRRCTSGARDDPRSARRVGPGDRDPAGPPPPDRCMAPGAIPRPCPGAVRPARRRVDQADDDHGSSRGSPTTDTWEEAVRGSN